MVYQLHVESLRKENSSKLICTSNDYFKVSLEKKRQQSFLRILEYIKC